MLWLHRGKEEVCILASQQEAKLVPLICISVTGFLQPLASIQHKYHFQADTHTHTHRSVQELHSLTTSNNILNEKAVFTFFQSRKICSIGTTSTQADTFFPRPLAKSQIQCCRIEPSRLCSAEWNWEWGFEGVEKWRGHQRETSRLLLCYFQPGQQRLKTDKN